MEVPFTIFDEVSLPKGHWLTAETEGDQVVLNVHVNCENSRSPGQMIEVVHPTVIPDAAIGDEIYMLSFIRHCLITLAIHEVDEWFRYRGELVNDPHRSPYQQSANDIVEFEAAREP